MHIKLYCIPYAGASSVIFNKWNRMMNSSVEVIPMELAGRGGRTGEPFYNNISDAVDDLYKQISQDDHTSFAIFGHSMGAIIAFELTKRLCEKQQGPKVLICSGRKAPQFHSKEIIHNLEEKEFIKRIIELGATPAELFESQELTEIFLPILQSDFKIIEEYRYSNTRTHMNCDLVVMSGQLDDISQEELFGWQQHSSKPCLFQFFEGGHFFIHDNEAEVINYLDRLLTSC